MFESIFVVDDGCANVHGLPDRQTVSASEYLNGSRWPARVINLCDLRYQSAGYYVSLLAEARGQQSCPSVQTIHDLRIGGRAWSKLTGIECLAQRALRDRRDRALSVFLCVGHCSEPALRGLACALFAATGAPLLELDLVHGASGWRIARLRVISLDQLPPEQWPTLAAAARRASRANARSRSAEMTLGIVHDPGSADPPSNPLALSRFADAARRFGLRPLRLTAADANRVLDCDLLLIRDTTAIDHYTYRFAHCAAEAGIAVIDDPLSILRCNNKVFLAELFARHGVPAPRTLLLGSADLAAAATQLSYPAVLKQPDSAFSRGVVKVASPAELLRSAQVLLQRSALIVAQEYLASSFDWRVGVLDGQPLFACQYFMAPGHWQVIKRHRGQKLDEGATVAVPIDAVPTAVLDAALRAARLIGDGLYGVDIKQCGDQVYVIEVNDNPNIDAGNEDRVSDDLYQAIIASLIRRGADQAPPTR